MVDESPLAVAQEMANVLFNLSQAEGQKLTADECRQLRALYARWDIALVPRIGAVPVALPAPSREEVWMRAWCAVGGAFNCQKPEDATRWANKALAAFDERFPPK